MFEDRIHVSHRFKNGSNGYKGSSGAELSQNALQIFQDSLGYKKRQSNNKAQCIDMKMKKEIGV